MQLTCYLCTVILIVLTHAIKIHDKHICLKTWVLFPVHICSTTVLFVSFFFLSCMEVSDPFNDRGVG